MIVLLLALNLRAIEFVFINLANKKEIDSQNNFVSFCLKITNNYILFNSQHNTTNQYSSFWDKVLNKCLKISDALNFYLYG